MKKLIFLVVCLLSGGMPVFRANLSRNFCDRAVTYTEQDSLPQAGTYIRQSASWSLRNPHNALLFSNLGTIQRRQRKYEKALESYNFALNIAPRAVPILLNRCDHLYGTGAQQPSTSRLFAGAGFGEKQRRSPADAPYIICSSVTIKMAKADYERLLKVNPTSYNGRLGLATFRAKRENTKKH